MKTTSAEHDISRFLKADVFTCHLLTLAVEEKPLKAKFFEMK